MKQQPELQEPISPEVLEKRIMTLLQFARKAGRLVHGFEACKKNIVNKNIKLLILAGDLADNTQSKIINALKAAESPVPMHKFSTQEELSASLGLPFTGVIGITDNNFAGKLLSYFEQ